MTIVFWIVFAGTLFGILLIALTFMILFKVKIGQTVSNILKDPASIEMITLINKLTWRHFFENNLRAETGKPLKRPFGTPLHFFKLDQYQFNPIYLSRKPLSSDVPIKTEVVIGPRAKKPLHLKVPILVGAMSYGNALSFKARVTLSKASTLTGTATNFGSGAIIEEYPPVFARVLVKVGKDIQSSGYD